MEERAEDLAHSDRPATGERGDHHNHAPGVAVPGSSGTDPAAPMPDEPEDDSEQGEGPAAP